jgi:hypothetical protein
MKISKEEIEAFQTALRQFVFAFADEELTECLTSSLTVRKRLKAERKAAKRANALCESAFTFADEIAKEVSRKGPKWDGRMNVWIPWEAKVTSECPVPEISYGWYRFRDGEEVSDCRLDMCNWKPMGAPTIAAYMVTSIKEQGA